MRYFIFLFIILLMSPARALDTSGLQISGAGDVVGAFNAPQNGGTQADDKISPREFEILLYSPIDHLFDATINTAAHIENGEQKFELHEGYLSSSKLIPNSHFRVGKFFLGLGRLNQVHRHEWPFVSAPKVQTLFFNDEEGAQDSGAEYGILLPTNFYLDFTVGYTNGWTFGAADSVGAQPLFPTHYARLTTFAPMFGEGDALIGLNYLSRTDNTNLMMTLWGLDFTSKWKDGKVLKYLFQSEFWYRLQSMGSAAAAKDWGAYVYPQYGFNENWSLGSRFDLYSNTTLSPTNLDYAFVPTLAYKASEFSTFRLAYTREFVSQSNQIQSDSGKIEVQATFIIGAHPAHSF